MRRQNALYQPHAQECTHLGQALKRGFPRVRDFPFVRSRRQVAVRQAAIIMRWPDKAIEIGFDGGHARKPVIGSSSFTTPGAIKLAIGQAE